MKMCCFLITHLKVTALKSTRNNKSINSVIIFNNLPDSFIHCAFLYTRLSFFYLFDLVAGAGDALGDALVGPDGCGEFGIMLNNLLI